MDAAELGTVPIWPLNLAGPRLWERRFEQLKEVLFLEAYEYRGKL